MPKLDGFALTAEIRRSEALRQIPVILLTSMDEGEHRARGMEAGADAYLVKSGFEQTQLLDTVGRLL
jgi:two-component system chemotaxis sensor kinase CheA